MSTDDMVNDYLAELDRVTVGLEPTTRAELLQEVRQHIIDARADGEDVREVLTRLGSPAEIAQAAGMPRSSSRNSGQAAYDLATVFLLAVGGLFPFLGWILGVVLLWNGPRWTRRDRLIGTLVPPLGATGVLGLAPILSGLGSLSCEQSGNDISCVRVLVAGWLGTAILVLWVTVGLAVAAYLLYRASTWRVVLSWLGLAPRQVWLVPIFAILVVLALVQAGLVVRAYVQDARGQPVPLRDASQVCGWVGDLSDGGQSLRVDTRGEAAGTGTANVGDVVCVLDQLKAPPGIKDELMQAQIQDVHRSRMWDGFAVSWTYDSSNGLDVVIRES